MITVTNERIKPEGACTPWSDTRKVEHAFRSLVEYEIGYGGQVIECEPNKVKIKTMVMNCADYTTFEGLMSDMEPLVIVAACTSAVWASCFDKLTSHAFDALNRRGIGVSPFMLKLGGDQLMGAVAAKTAMIAAFSLVEFKNKSLDDMMTAAMLIYSGEDRAEVYAAFGVEQQPEGVPA